MKSGDSLAMHVRQLQIQANRRSTHDLRAAFAAILDDGSVVPWGDDRDGDSSAVQDQLNVRRIQTFNSAFAAILGDGSVVTGVMTEMPVTAVRCKTS